MMVRGRMSDRSWKPPLDQEKLNRIYKNVKLDPSGDDQVSKRGEIEIMAELDARMVPNRQRSLHERVVRRVLADAEPNWTSQDITVSRMCDAWRLKGLEEASKQLRRDREISHVLNRRFQVMKARSTTEREMAQRKEEDRAARQNLKIFSDMIWMIDRQNKARLENKRGRGRS